MAVLQGDLVDGIECLTAPVAVGGALGEESPQVPALAGEQNGCASHGSTLRRCAPRIGVAAPGAGPSGGLSPPAQPPDRPVPRRQDLRSRLVACSTGTRGARLGSPPAPEHVPAYVFSASPIGAPKARLGESARRPPATRDRWPGDRC